MADCFGSVDAPSINSRFALDRSARAAPRFFTGATTRDTDTVESLRRTSRRHAARMADGSVAVRSRVIPRSRRGRTKTIAAAGDSAHSDNPQQK